MLTLLQSKYIYANLLLKVYIEDISNLEKKIEILHVKIFVVYAANFYF